MGKFQTLIKTFIYIAILQASSVVAKPLTLIYSGNLDGELEPCGCSAEGNLGGIKRRATIVDQLKQQIPEMILVSAGGLLASEGPGDGLKSEYILKGFSELHYDAVGLQWRDLVYGKEFIATEKIPWVASNWQGEEVQHSQQITRKIANKTYTLTVFSWLDVDRSPMRQMQGQHTLIHDRYEELMQQLHAAKQQGQLTLLSTTFPVEIAQEKLSLSDVDILIVQSAYEQFSEPQEIDNTIVLQPGSRGMRIARLDFEINDNNKISSWKHEIIPLPELIADAPRLAPWYNEYNQKVKEDYLRRTALRKKQQSGESKYIGEAACKTCHMAQHTKWTESQHAIAFEDLEAVNKSFDPACIVCHTVGFNQDGGFVDIEMSSHLMGVQCESCHGPSRDHVQSGGKKPVTNYQWEIQKICGQCHTQPHSPSFSLQNYWPKIAH